MVLNIDKNYIRRIAIIGTSGSGKTTLANELHEITGLPVHHVDNIIWENYSKVVSKNQYIKEHDDLIKQNSWIIEGYLDEEMSERVILADLVIYLKYPKHISSYRYLNRWWKSLFSSDKKLYGSFKTKLRVLFDYFTESEKKDIGKVLSILSSDKIILVESSKDMVQFIKSIKDKFADSSRSVY